MKKKSENLQFPINILGYPTCPKMKEERQQIIKKKNSKQKNKSDNKDFSDNDWDKNPESINDYF